VFLMSEVPLYGQGLSMVLEGGAVSQKRGTPVRKIGSPRGQRGPRPQRGTGVPRP
jgi:hypothetical protein